MNIQGRIDELETNVTQTDELQKDGSKLEDICLDDFRKIDQHVRRAGHPTDDVQARTTHMHDLSTFHKVSLHRNLK